MADVPKPPLAPAKDNSAARRGKRSRGFVGWLDEAITRANSRRQEDADGITPVLTARTQELVHG